MKKFRHLLLEKGYDFTSTFHYKVLTKNAEGKENHLEYFKDEASARAHLKRSNVPGLKLYKKENDEWKEIGG